MSTEAIINYSQADKVQQFKSLMNDPEVQPFFQSYIENIVNRMLPTAVEAILATSELKVLKRISTLESMLITDGLDFDDEEHVPTIPEQLKELSERIEHPLSKAIESIKIELPVIPKTSLEHKASELVEHLKTNVKPRNGEVFLNTREIIHFLKYEISEEYRIKDIQNPRQVKKAVIERARKLFPDTITLSQKKHGTKDVRIVYKAYGFNQYIHTPEK
jgi:hypothetical protein